METRSLNLIPDYGELGATLVRTTNTCQMDQNTAEWRILQGRNRLFCLNELTYSSFHVFRSKAEALFFCFPHSIRVVSSVQYPGGIVQGLTVCFFFTLAIPTSERLRVFVLLVVDFEEVLVIDKARAQGLLMR